VQACAADGASYGECDCSPAGSNGGSGGNAGASGGGTAGSASSGAAGAGSQPGTAQFDGATGLPCSVDTDCFGGMSCIPSSAPDTPFGPGGPQGGYCTSVCSDSADCVALDRLSDCFPLNDGSAGFCLAVCPLGTTSPLGPSCAGRNDLACADVFPAGSTAGLCLPTCWSDADCDGRVCDLGSGLCVDSLTGRGTGGIGAACNAATELTDCASGVCFPVEEDGAGFCTGFCTLAPGGPVGCGFGPDGARDAACTPIQQGAIAGDQGFCLELCDVTADCAQPALYTCEALQPESQEFLGRAGQCLPADGGAGADAGADAG
jgi:hypothetical protein